MKVFTNIPYRSVSPLTFVVQLTEYFRHDRRVTRSKRIKALCSNVTFDFDTCGQHCFESILQERCVVALRIRIGGIVEGFAQENFQHVIEFALLVRKQVLLDARMKVLDTAFLGSALDAFYNKLKRRTDDRGWRH